MTMCGAVIITGASRGIGAALARLIGSEGSPVIVNYSSSQLAAESVVDEITSGGGTAIALRADMRREDEIVRLFESAISKFGRIRGLVNNAGVTGGFARVEDASVDSIDDVLRVNVAGLILCCREAVRHMSVRRGGGGGAIVNVSSLVARTGGASEWVHHAASKGAVNSFTIGLAREVAEEGIRVNAVAPGLIDTGIHSANGRPDRLKEMEPSIPMKRAGSAQEVAHGVEMAITWPTGHFMGEFQKLKIRLGAKRCEKKAKPVPAVPENLRSSRPRLKN